MAEEDYYNFQRPIAATKGIEVTIGGVVRQRKISGDPAIRIRNGTDGWPPEGGRPTTIDGQRRMILLEARRWMRFTRRSRAVGPIWGVVIFLI